MAANVAGLTQVTQGPPVRVYRNENAMPRAFLVDRQELAGAGALRRAEVSETAASVPEQP
jgi:hypothetical protein